jgi:hypothetical protein
MSDDERERFIEALRPPTKWHDRGRPTEKILVRFMDRDDAEEMYDDHLVPLIAAHDKRVRAEALREAADECEPLADGFADWLRARADAEEGK